MMTATLVFGLALLLADVAPAQQSRLVRDSLPTELVSAGSVDYAVLLPDRRPADGGPLPLVLMLHGAGGDREVLARFKPQIRRMWAAGELPELVVVSPSVGRGSIYMDSYDGSERWETFLMREFLPHLREEFPISGDREDTVVTGSSMGGFGSLRLGFKHPHVFGAVAAMQPGAWPGLTWDEVPDRNKIRSPESIAALFGDPFDHDRFLTENPASIVESDPSRLRESEIYIEVGDEDGFGFVEGVDFMHRLLWRHRIRHEYRLVRWADHGGRTLMERSRDRFRFVARYLEQPLGPDPALAGFRARLARGHQSRGMEPFGHWPNSMLRSYMTDDGDENLARAARDSAEVRSQRGVIRIADIPYAAEQGVDAARQSLDIYLADGLADAPIVLYVHGGGWRWGDKMGALFKPAALVPEGYLFASMNYRFSPGATLNDMALDVARAAVWVRRHGAGYGGDPARIVLMGHSAGAHLVSVVATNPAFIEEAGGSLSDLSGVIAIDTGMLNVPLRMETAGPSQIRVFGSDPDAWIPVSPWHHVEEGTGIPPFLLLIAGGREITLDQGAVFKEKAAGAGIEVSSFEAEGRKHMPLDTYIGVDGDESTRMVLRFLERHAKPN